MPIPRAVARFNRRVTNPLARLIAGWVPPFAIVVNRGRVSRRRYETPVAAFRSRGGFVMALTYGADADWVRNVLAAGGCLMQRAGHSHTLVDPRIVTGTDGMRLVPAVVRLGLRVLRANEFLQLTRPG
jgi:deazaflavin-dependent oxidoreductase (nitroreductase family)